MTDDSRRKISCMAEPLYIVCDDEAVVIRRARLSIGGQVCTDSFQEVIDECVTRWGQGHLKKHSMRIEMWDCDSDYEWIKDETPEPT